MAASERRAEGAVRGTTVTELEKVTAYIYRGIPYAAPPVGELRWKAPQPAAAWKGERDATQWPNRCPQGASNMGTGSAISEDCLYLNVVTAAKASGEKRPVIVFYHGGGLTSGTGNSTTYNHPTLANKGVVIVTVNSRLGAIGYLALLDYHLSVAVWVGIIALAGVAAETGVVMIIFLDEAYERWQREGRLRSVRDLHKAIIEGAVQRVRPKMATVMTIITDC